ncbi:MAG: DUF4254 domain-containing protein [Leptospiraceae bacterium]|nr:DUF4254 domain-containing protein [Leptospiraceae bacterium]
MLPETSEIISVMENSVKDWHIQSKEHPNPFQTDSFLYLIYKKNQVDTIQWHVEDEIRRPDLSDKELVGFKRQIDSLNQVRTDIVEQLDDWFLNYFQNITPKKNARMNSETPAWLLDRMSILELKIYHMHEQTERKDAEPSHIQKCSEKLSILLSQREDLKTCFTELVGDIQNGDKFMKVYRQMKMYNDKNLNPSLYKKQ